MKERILLLSIFSLIFLLLFLNFSLSSQLTFNLDLDFPAFNFSLNSFNDSATTKEIVFSGSENKTVWLRLPKNSTVFSSNLSLEGIMKPLLSTTNLQIYSLAVGNVIPSNQYDEIAIGTSGPSYVKLLNNNGNEIWNFSTNGDVYAVSIGNLSSEEGNEIAAGSSGGYVYLLNSSGSQLWNFSGSSSFKGVGAGNLSSEEGNEIAAGTVDGYVYLLNSSGYLKISKPVGTGINDLAVGNVIPSNQYDEIAIAGNNGTIFLLDSNLNFLCSFNTQASADTVLIADVTSDPGSEIIAGSYDDRVYVLNSSCSLVWSYLTQNDVRGVGAGNLTADPGTEVAAGTNIPATYTVYILNFEYYPTNLTLDIGDDEEIEWQYPGKFRSQASISNNSAFNKYLESCEADSNGNCDIPLKFHSDFAGILRIASVYLEYQYNLSGVISYSFENAWSRIYNIRVNESIGNKTINISYAKNPALDIRINYIKVNDSATKCDFNDFSFNVTPINGKKYCNITSLNYVVNSSGPLSPAKLWDDTLGTGIPIIMNESEGIIEEGFWKKNITIWNTTPQIFYNITANTTINESFVISQPKLRVFWSGSWQDITPSSASNNCNSSSPTYYKINVGSDSFFVCKQDTNSNGIEDLFVWKQPHSSTTLYEASGSGNSPPTLSNINVTPSQGIWGSEFNISLNVSDRENDNITVRLLVNIKNLNFWQLIGEKNFTGNTSITFNLTTNKTWVGMNEFKFEYADFNSSSGLQYHDWINSSVYYGPNVTKRNASVIYVEGNNSQVNRSETVLLSIQLKDNFDNQNIPNANCSFWVWLNSTHNSSYSTSSDENGFCNYSFTPNSSYQPGGREWKAGTYFDSFYETNISSGFLVKIYGKLSIRLNSVSNFTRGDSLLNASLVDEFNSSVKVAGYNCSWFINNTLENETQTDSNGYCFHTWKTNCSSSLGYYSLNVTLSGNASEYYFLNVTSQEILRALKDKLNITIISPLPNSVYHLGEEIRLNSTLNDSCGLAVYPYIITWTGSGTTDPGWQTCSMSVQGDNSSYTVASNCVPGIFLIKANASGELYNSDEKNVSVWIYGWAEVNFTHPSENQKINKAETEMVDLVCHVKDSNSSVDLESYPVYFWFINSTEENLLAQVKTNFSGYAKYSWNISDLADLVQVKCNISDTNVSFYRYYNASVKESSVSFTIMENDTTPPTIESLKADSAVLGQDVKIEVNVSDKYGVDKVWVNVSFPNSSYLIYYLQNKTSQTTNTTWEKVIAGANIIGDYDFVLFANDTSNNFAQKTGWFEVYEPIQMYLNASFPVDFTFYRPSKDILIHNYSKGPGNYNFTLHKRTYDWLIRLGENSVKMFNFNTTKTSELQFNNPNANLTNPINLSEISVSIIDLPRPEKYKISAFEIKTNASYSNLKITFNYSKDFNEGKIWYEPGIKIYKCADWSYPTCNSGWTETDSSLDLTNHLISTVQASASAYVAAEIEVCGNGKCGYGESCVNCPEDCGQCPTTYTPPSGPGGVPSAPSIPEVTPTEEVKFSIRTNLTDAQIDINESKNFGLWILNEMNSRLNFTVSISGSIADLVKLERNSITVEPKNEGMVVINAYAPPRTELGTYTGTIYVTAGRKTQNLPATLTVSIKGLVELDIVAEALNKQINPDRVARFRVVLYNLGIKKNFDANFTFLIQDPETKETVFSTSKIKSLQSSYESFIEEIYIPQNISLGQYLFVVEAEYDGRKKSSSDLFEVVQPFWTTERIQLASILIVALFSVFSFFYGRSYYKKWKVKKARYIAPVKIGKLPKGELWLGKVAEARAKATFAMDDLTTHVLVAGATGSGKSVTASLFVEELLEKKIPAVVFDPTAQWTGFVRPCKDPKVLKYYRIFGLAQEEARPFKGLIFEVTDPKVEIDFKKLMNPGEITIFTLDKLKPGQYDEAVTHIIDTIFAQGWEESTSLRLVIVFDEVHRLLEKYGGKGGYVALERACREFRKWGIGLIMVSQVLSDFKEAIKGNVLTEIQMHTKSLGDLARIEKKYGLEYAKRVARLEVGVGLIQNQSITMEFLGSSLSDHLCTCLTKYQTRR
ncbi:MAG: helicase HerA domain-containing protein [Candidatus Aenigmatarchaeota archaeon]